MANRPTKDELLEQTHRLTEFVSHPVLLEELRDLERVPESRRLEEAQRRLSLQALSAKGVPVPDGIRITLRYFENPETRLVTSLATSSQEGLREPNIIQELASNPRLFAELSRSHPEVVTELASKTLAPDLTACISAGYFVCVSVGRKFFE
jgi:hypothetical protein